MKNFTHFYCVIFVCCASTGLASERPEFGPRGSGVEHAPSTGRNATTIHNYEGNRVIQKQKKDIMIVIPRDSREVQQFRDSKEIHLKIEERTFEGIEPHHFNELDFTQFRQNPVLNK